ncbi:MAG: hypothetical protein ABI707_18755, partial [Ferruginibacter sp.]
IYSIAFDNKKSKLFAVDDFTFLKLKHRGSDILYKQYLEEGDITMGRFPGITTLPLTKMKTFMLATF